MPEKPIALFIAATTLAALIAQLIVGLDLYGPIGLLEMTWYLLGFFTIVTHISVVLMLTAVGLGVPVPVNLRSTLTLATTGVGLIFHLLLADLYSLEGLAWWADLALHTLIPLSMLAWWALYTPKHQITWKGPFLWVCYPIGYGFYSLLRGPLNITDSYPYPFLDPTELGYAGIAKVFIAMSVGFLLFGQTMASYAKATDPSRARTRRRRR